MPKLLRAQSGRDQHFAHAVRIAGHHFESALNLVERSGMRDQGCEQADIFGKHIARVQRLVVGAVDVEEGNLLLAQPRRMNGMWTQAEGIAV